MPNIYPIIFALLLTGRLLSAEKLRFDDHRVYQLKIDNEHQLSKLQSLEQTNQGYTFFEPPARTNMTVRLLVSPNLLFDFNQMIDSIQINAQLMVKNIQELMDAETPLNQPKALEWTSYHTLAEMYNWFDEIAATNPNVVSLTTIGTSYEGRALRVVKISYKTGNRGIFIESNIHAREWITSATATWIINELLTSNDPAIRNIAENYDWYIIPVINPDGFQYTKDVNRMWRKTRSFQANECIGVDANRNFGYNWMQGGASSNPCSDTFAGNEPYSEVEIRSLVDYYVTIAHHIDVYLSFHSYSQYLLTPLGTTNSPLANQAHVMQIASAAGTALKERFGTEYSVGNWVDVLYLSSGISIDWAYGAAQTPIAYTYEFRDTGVNGFILPPEQIIPNAQEVLDSLVALIREASGLGYLLQSIIKKYK